MREIRRMTPVRIVHVPLAAALLLALLPATTRAAGLILERPGRSAEIEITAIARREYVDLADVATFFDLSFDRDRKRAVISGASGNIEVHVGRAMVTVAGQPVVLAGQVELQDRRVLVPLDFLTRAMPRLLGVEARQDRTANAIRFDSSTSQVTCESFDDRMRVTIRPRKPAVLSEIVRDGQRRVVTIMNQELPAQVGGCQFDEALTDLEIRPEKGRTRVTFFVGPRFASMKVLEVEADDALVFDFLTDAAPAPPAATATVPDAMKQPGSRDAGDDVFDTVVIDAGHGGTDHGATGPGGLKEKDVTLAVAQELARVLRERAGLSVLLTRDGDDSASLLARTETANRRQADLFLSIHANATPAGQATGAETYFLHADATDERSRTVAAIENDATGLRERGQAGGPLEIVLWDLAQQQYLGESSRLAEVVQAELNVLAGIKDRGVKQANFLVLRGATMPAILVEIGFLSNPAEERRMRTPEFQRAIAEALLRAILAFRDERQARRR
jgi:N-acetylmuramoyl-L-alanine amidase